MLAAPGIAVKIPRGFMLMATSLVGRAFIFAPNRPLAHPLRVVALHGD
jgi:hypothetical protein